MTLAPPVRVGAFSLTTPSLRAEPLKELALLLDFDRAIAGRYFV